MTRLCFSEHAVPLFCLQEGTTYNSYLIFGDKTALVDASHEKFRGLYLKALKEQLAARGRSLNYIVVSHTEPDHSGEPPRAWRAASLRHPVQSQATAISQCGAAHVAYADQTLELQWRSKHRASL